MNSKLDSARKELTNADNWVKSCMYQTTPSPMLVRAALLAARTACAILQEVDSSVSGLHGETKSVEDVELLREKLNRKM